MREKLGPDYSEKDLVGRIRVAEDQVMNQATAPEQQVRLSQEVRIYRRDLQRRQQGPIRP